MLLHDWSFSRPIYSSDTGGNTNTNTYMRRRKNIVYKYIINLQLFQMHKFRCHSQFLRASSAILPVSTVVFHFFPFLQKTFVPYRTNYWQVTCLRQRPCILFDAFHKFFIRVILPVFLDVPFLVSFHTCQLQQVFMLYHYKEAHFQLIIVDLNLRNNSFLQQHRPLSFLFCS